MCTTIYADQEDRSTPRKLAEWLGIRPDDIIRSDRRPSDYPAPGWEDCCLCPFDVRATLDKHGAWSWRDEMGDLHAIKRGPDA